jgi:DNA-binding CsgD family transcriptional regulator
MVRVAGLIQRETNARNGPICAARAHGRRGVRRHKQRSPGDSRLRPGSGTAPSDGITNFDLEVTTRSGERLWANVSTIVFDNPRTGRRLYVRLARDMTHRRRKERLFTGMVELAQQVVTLTDDESDYAPVEVLSDQERRILKLFADGNNPGAIVRKLTISPQTLRNHLHHINRKLRTHNRLEAVTHAQRRGLIE